MSIPEPRISFATENAILLKFAEPSLNVSSDHLQGRLHALARTLQMKAEARALLEDAVVGPASLLLVLYDGCHAEPLLRQAEALWLDAASLPDHTSRVVRIPVRYGGEMGPDLEHVARATGLAPQEVIARHSQGRYRVDCLGFLAGFAYIGGLDSSLYCARKTVPAIRIAPGSIAIGGTRTGIYPTESPGGWHIIGRTGLCLFDPARPEPSLLQPGDEIRFEIMPDDASTDAMFQRPEDSRQTHD